MKKPFYKYLIFLMPCLLIMLATSSCKKDIGEIVREQEQNSIFYPRIFDRSFVFGSPKTISQGDTVRYERILYSPADKVSISWKVDGKEVSKDTKYYFIGTTPGDYKITLDVTYQGDSTNRTSLVKVNQ